MFIRKTSYVAGLLIALTNGPAAALGADSYLGTVGLVGGSYCPKGTMEANGQLLPIAQYGSLYSLFGSRYGGDGMTRFGLPNLTEKVPQQGMRYCVVIEGKLPPHN